MRLVSIEDIERDYRKRINELKNEIKALKEKKTGHWVHGDLLFACYDTVDGESKFVRNIYAGNTCSLCGVKIGDFGTEEPYKFCPYCGYPMESEGD